MAEIVTKISKELSEFRDTVIDMDCFSLIYTAAKNTQLSIYHFRSIDDINNNDGYDLFTKLIDNRTGKDIYSSLHRVLS